jgi:hypothetical protein
MASTLSAIVDLWWLRIPAAAGQVWRPAASLLSDGIALAACPLVAALAPPTAFLVGLFAGWLLPHAGEAYTSSVLALALMLAVAYAGVALGIWVWLGYVVADTLLIAHPLPGYSWLERLFLVRGSLLVSYLLLAALLVGIPLASRALAGLIVSGRRSAGRARRTIRSALQPLLLGAMVYAWVQAIPVLIQPVSTWQKRSPPAGESLHNWGWLIPVVAMIICAARLSEVRWAVRLPAVKQRLGQLQRAAAGWPRRESRLPTGIAAAARASTMTLALSGLFSGWADGIICVAFLTILGIAQADWLGKLSSWTKAVSYLPVVVRVSLGLAIGFGFRKLILVAGQPHASYRPALLSMAVTMIVVALLVPKPAPTSGQLKAVT